MSKQALQAVVAQPHPEAFPHADQHMGHRRAYQFRIRPPLRMAKPTLARRNRLIVDHNVQRHQQDVHVCWVCYHAGSWAISPPYPGYSTTPPGPDRCQKSRIEALSSYGAASTSMGISRLRMPHLKTRS